MIVLRLMITRMRLFLIVWLVISLSIGHLINKVSNRSKQVLVGHAGKDQLLQKKQEY